MPEIQPKMSALPNGTPPPPPPRSGRAHTSLYVRAQPGLKLRDKRIERLARKVRAEMPWLEPSDFPAVRAWAELEYLAGQVYAALRTLGVLNRAGEARRLLNDYRLLRQTQTGLSAALGMTPLARVQLKATSTRAALDLAAAMAAPEDADVVDDDGKSRPT